MSVSKPTRMTYWFPVTKGMHAAATRKAMNRAESGTRRTRRTCGGSGAISESGSATQGSVPIRLISSPLQRRASEKPVRAEDHEPDQHEEDDQELERRCQVSRDERFRETEQQAAQHRAGDAADSTDDRGGEPLQPGDKAHRVRDLEEHEPDHHAGGAGEC